MFNEYRTYNANREADVNWQSVDDRKIFELISDMYALPANNAVMPFETSQEIISLLKEQWAGLFQRLLMDASNQPSLALVQQLRQSLELSRKLAEGLAAHKTEGEGIVQDVLLTTHPIFDAIKSRMSIPYRVFFTTKQELDAWLNARSFKIEDDLVFDTDYFEWENFSINKGKQIGTVQVWKALFDEDGQLRPIRVGQWRDEWVKYSVRVKKAVQAVDDDIPF